VEGSELSAVEIIQQLRKIQGKFEKTMGVRVWGVDAEGIARTLRTDADGKLKTVSSSSP